MVLSEGDGASATAKEAAVTVWFWPGTAAFGEMSVAGVKKVFEEVFFMSLAPKALSETKRVISPAGLFLMSTVILILVFEAAAKLTVSANTRTSVCSLATAVISFGPAIK